MESMRTIIPLLLICTSAVLSVNGMDRKNEEYKQGVGLQKTDTSETLKNVTTVSMNYAINDYATPSLKHNSSNSFVGFTAWKETDQIYEYGDIIIFDGITVNEGAHYKPTLNWFVCPHNAVYYVAVTFKGDSANHISIEVMKETERILCSWSLYDYNPSNVVSNSGIVRCDQGERIWVQGYRDHVGAVAGEPGIPHTTFTIFMMYEGEISPVTERHENFIGFSAWKGSPQQYISGDTIGFDVFLFNEGNYYLPAVNRFECAVTGIYYVVVHLRKYLTHDHLLGVDKSTYTILHSEDTGGDNSDNVLSNSRLVHCTAGEYISVVATGDGYVDGYSTFQSSTFSVMLLHQENQGKGKHSSFIGFSAWNKVDQSYDIGDTIVFDGIMINEGSHYQPGTLSRFICPVPGIYYIAVTFKKLGTNGLQLGVQHQSTGVLRSVDTETDNPHNVLSNSCLVRCFPGEIIQVKATGSGWVHGDASKSHTTFTIIIMHEY